MPPQPYNKPQYHRILHMPTFGHFCSLVCGRSMPCLAASPFRQYLHNHIASRPALQTHCICELFGWAPWLSKSTVVLTVLLLLTLSLLSVPFLHAHIQLRRGKFRGNTSCGYRIEQHPNNTHIPKPCPFLSEVHMVYCCKKSCGICKNNARICKNKTPDVSESITSKHLM